MQCLRFIDVLVPDNFGEMLVYLKANEKIMPVYYARIQVNVYDGFVFTYSSQLDEMHGAWAGIDIYND